MISFCFRIFLTLSLIVSATCAIGQNEPVLWQSQFTVNHKLDYNWALNLNSVYRATILEDLDESWGLTTEHLEFSSNVSRAVGFYGKLATGMMYRFNSIANGPQENELRITQQYSHGKHFNALRVIHRFKLDQRIRKSGNEFRFRYRFSSDFPLSGLKLDVRECYLVLSSETLFNLAENKPPALDQRFVTGIGYQVTTEIKLQLQLEYRLENFALNTARRAFINTAVFYKL